MEPPSPPVISLQQAKKTLSGKKAKRETIKNVLAKPYEHFWPQLDYKDNKWLTHTLERVLPRLKHEKVNVPFAEIKAIPKHDRKKFRQSFSKLEPLVVDEITKGSIVFGINDVALLLEVQEAASVLIASDVKPRFMVDHVLDLAVLYNVPVLVVDDLRDVFKTKCGISGSVVAFKHTIATHPELNNIQRVICTMYKSSRYPVPESHINYNRRLNGNAVVNVSDSDDCDNRSKNCVSVISINDSDEEENGGPANSALCRNCHLQRGPNRKRAFVPGVPGSSQVKATVICLDSPAPSPVISSNTIATITGYRPLVVKRVKGDSDRNKRKIENFKMLT